MNILIVGSTLPGAMEHAILRGLKLDSRVNRVEIKTTDAFHASPSVVNKVLRRLSPNFYPGIAAFNQQLNKEVEAGDWDVLLVFKGMEIRPAVLRNLRNRIFLVNYNPDNPFIYSGIGSGNLNMTKSFSLFHLYLTYDRDIATQIERNGIASGVVPFGFEDNRRFDNILDPQNEIVKACFLGNADENRAHFLMRFAEEVPLDLVGSGWDKFRFPTTCRLHPPVYGDAFFDTLRKYRIQLNLMRPHNPNSHNMRSFDIVGSGGVGLMPRTADHTDYFDEGRHLFLFDDVEDAIVQAKAILAEDAETIGTLRSQARAWAVDQGFNYDERAAQMVDCIDRIWKTS